MSVLTRGSVRRGAAFTAVIAVHVVLIAVAALGSRVPQPPDHGSFASIWIVAPEDPAPEPLRPLPRLSLPSSIGSIHLELPQIPSASPPTPSERSGAINWESEARQAAANTARDLGSGSPQSAQTGDGNALRPPAHQAGESYRNSFGDQVYWVSERCYLVSATPPLGTPDVFARMQVSRVGCIDPRPSSGELFKELVPDYLKQLPGSSPRSAP